MKKAYFGITLLFVSLIILTACGTNQDVSSGGNGTTESDFPNNPITMTVSFSAGGSSDTGVRTLTPFLEEQLGVSVNVVNKPGGGGWVGWTDLANAKPDGYTLGYINVPNLFTGYLNPNIEREHNLNSFTPIANHITDPSVIMIRPDDKRFSNFKELIEYAKNHTVTATSGGVAGDDHIAMLKINKQLGTKFEPVHNQGDSKSSAQVLGGHVDVYFGNVGGATPLQENGQLKGVAVMDDERAPTLSDVPTIEDAGYEMIKNASTRGFAAPADIDPEKLKVLQSAFEKAINNKEHLEKMKGLGLNVDFVSGEDYTKMLRQEEKEVKEVLDLVEWE